MVKGHQRLITRYLPPCASRFLCDVGQPGWAGQASWAACCQFGYFGLGRLWADWLGRPGRPFTLFQGDFAVVVVVRFGLRQAHTLHFDRFAVNRAVSRGLSSSCVSPLQCAASIRQQACNPEPRTVKKKVTANLSATFQLCDVVIADSRPELNCTVLCQSSWMFGLT